MKNKLSIKGIKCKLFIFALYSASSFANNENSEVTTNKIPDSYHVKEYMTPKKSFDINQGDNLIETIESWCSTTLNCSVLAEIEGYKTVFTSSVILSVDNISQALNQLKTASRSTSKPLDILFYEKDNIVRICNKRCL